MLINERVDTFSAFLSMIGCMWLEHQVIFETTQKQFFIQFLEELGHTLTIPKVRMWFSNSLHGEPHLTYAVVNVLEQGYILCADMSAKQRHITAVTTTAYTNMVTNNYTNLLNLACIFANRIISASKGDEYIVECNLWRNSAH